MLFCFVNKVNFKEAEKALALGGECVYNSRTIGGQIERHSDMVTLSPSEPLLKLYELAKSLGYRLGAGIVNGKFKVVMIKGD